jgi:hypothetical protein
MSSDVMYDDIKSNALILENDLDALGWDRPARLYALLPQDDHAIWRLVTEVDGHPIEFLKVAKTMHGPLPQEIMGIALAHEGWTFPRDMVKGKTAEQLKELYAMMAPSEHPHREELRMVYVVLRDGRSMSVVRVRGEEEEPQLQDIKDGESSGHLVDAVRGLLDLPPLPDVA